MSSTPSSPSPSSSSSSSSSPAAADPINVRLVRVGFSMAIRRDAGGVPRIAPEIVAEQGQLVRILDVRDEVELGARSATSRR